MSDCAPDCDERTNCDRRDIGHFLCGRCPECGEPRHHYCEHLRAEFAS